MENCENIITEETVDGVVEVAEVTSGKKWAKYGIGVAVICAAGYGCYKLYKSHAAKKAKDNEDPVDIVEVLKHDFLEADETNEETEEV